MYYSSLWKDCHISEKRIQEKEETDCIAAGLPVPEPRASATTTTILSDSQGSNRVPMIHVEDLSEQLLYLAASFINGVEATSYYYAATDVFPQQAQQVNTSTALSSSSSSWTMSGVFHFISEYLQRSVKFTSQSEVLELYYSETNQSLPMPLLLNSKFDWLQDISFVSTFVNSSSTNVFPTAISTVGVKGIAQLALNSSPKPTVVSIPRPELQYPNGLTTLFTKIWNQFLVSHQLVPCVMIITGASHIQGKSTIANGISKELGLNILDPVTCTQEIVSNQQLISKTDDPYSTISIGNGLRSRIITAVEAALKSNAESAASANVETKGGKGKKGATEAIAPVQGEITSLTKEMVELLPKQLIRQCITYKLYCNIKSGTYKGCILDINWDSSPIIMNKQDIVDIFEGRDLIVVPQGRKLGGGAGGGSIGSDSSRATTSRQHGVSTASIAFTAATKCILEVKNTLIWPDLIIEVQVSLNVLNIKCDINYTY